MAGTLRCLLSKVTATLSSSYLKNRNFMNRRQFTSLLGLAGVGIGSQLNSISATRKRLIKPARLQTGQRVGLITPASIVSDEKMEKAVNQLESWGLKVQLGRHVRQTYGSMAGSDAERLEDLHHMFTDNTIDAIWCARGGYGCTRLLADIDYSLIRKSPKILIGYSDITALHCAIQRQAGLVTFHGPVAASEYPEYTLEQVEKTLFEPEDEHVINLAEANITRGKKENAYACRVINPGTVTGPLTGGNLSLLASLAGTAYAPNIKGRIVFIEDIGESPYRIDRMLTTLRQAWPMEQAAAIVLGIFHNCEADEGSHSLSLQETITDRLADLSIPIISGFSFGHIDHQCTFPMGINARLDTTAKTLTLLEAGVY